MATICRECNIVLTTVFTIFSSLTEGLIPHAPPENGAACVNWSKVKSDLAENGRNNSRTISDTMRGDERLCPNKVDLKQLVHLKIRTSKLEESDLKGDAISLQGKLKTARYIGKLEL